MTGSGAIYIGIKGHVLALDRATGTELWRVKVKGSDFVNVAMVDGEVYAAAQGELSCLDAATGTVRWNNPLKGLGWGLVSIAGDDGSQVLLGQEVRRRRAAAAAGGAAAASS